MSENTTIAFDASQLRLAANEEVERRITELGLNSPKKMLGNSSLKTASPERERAAEFLAAWISGDRASMKALSEGSDAAGGYLVPSVLRDEIVMRAHNASRLSKLVRRVGCRSNAVDVPTLATDVSVYWGSEGSDITESDAVFGTKAITIHRLNALTKISRELVSDAGIDLVDYLATLFAEAVAVEEDRVIALGTGSGQPEGLNVATGVGTYDVNGTIDYDALVEIFYTLDGRYRDRAVWLGSDAVFKSVRKLADSTGQPLWKPSLEENAPDRLLGRPVITQSGLPTTTLLFGDPSYYHIYDREEFAVEASTTAGDAFASHQLWLKSWERLDGKLMLAESWVKGTGITG